MMTQCKCGSKLFTVSESYVYEMELINGELSANGTPDGGLDEIKCKECGEHYKADDFENIIWD